LGLSGGVRHCCLFAAADSGVRAQRAIQEITNALGGNPYDVKAAN
jgi:hypothetical protein